MITASGFPGFIHNLTKANAHTPLGSTTLWEDWGGVSSHAHPVQGCVVSYFYEYLSGIQLESENPGFNTFTIKPAFLQQLQWVKSNFQTNFGDIVVNWERKENEIQVDLMIPINTNATFVLKQDTYGNNINLDLNVEKSVSIKRLDNFIEIILGSGRYSLILPLKK
jgi:alpha-L-rhamnosidase